MSTKEEFTYMRNRGSFRYESLPVFTMLNIKSIRTTLQKNLKIENN